MNRVLQKIAFIEELDKLKAVLRQTRPNGLDRFENSAEHSWQTTLAALLFLEDAPEGVDPLVVLKMLLIHDVVEIDCGDVFTYDETARADIAAQEEAAARRIFGILPDSIGQELLSLWLEFEEAQTATAQFAKAIDRVCPVIQNLSQSGQSWVSHGISRQRVLAKNAQIAQASEPLWDELNSQINGAAYLSDDI